MNYLQINELMAQNKMNQTALYMNNTKIHNLCSQIKIRKGKQENEAID